MLHGKEQLRFYHRQCDVPELLKLVFYAVDVTGRIELVRHSLGLLGLGFSVASAPPSSLPEGLPTVSMEQVDLLAYWLTQAKVDETSAQGS